MELFCNITHSSPKQNKDRSDQVHTEPLDKAITNKSKVEIGEAKSACPDS